MSDQTAILAGLKPRRVFEIFETICRIPRGSGNTDAISAWCVDFAEGLGLACRRDALNNVVIKKPGRGTGPAVILQAHLDMVCEKESDVEHDFEQEGLKLVLEDDLIRAQGTTLGGDDGIGVAMALAVLEDETLIIPDLEVVLTTDEETGMDGAEFLDCSDLSGKYLINVDSEAEGIITVGCAGGMRCEADASVRQWSEAAGELYLLSVDGLQGGHSGAEIHLGRANANKLLGRLLYVLSETAPFELADVRGGAKDNAIPRDAFAIFSIPSGCEADVSAALEAEADALKTLYGVTEPEMRIRLEKETASEVSVMDPVSAQKVIFLLSTTPCGVQAMNPVLTGLVDRSLNLGIVRTDSEGVHLTWSLRSNVPHGKTLMRDTLAMMTEMMGAEFTCRGDYPAWPFVPDAALTKTAADLYEKMYGKAPQVTTIHAGLECGLLSEKMPGTQMISIGPDLFDIHTPRERLSVSSTARVYDYLCRLLEVLGAKELPV